MAEKRVYEFTRHMFCEECERHNRPFKKQKGITLHLLRLIKVEGESVKYGAVCVLCGCKPIPNTKQVLILHEKMDVISIKDWNALIKSDPNDDGFTN